MKKRIIYGLVSIFLVCFAYICILYENTNNKPDKQVAALSLNLDCKSAYLIEESSKMVIYEQNAEERLAPASMTKMMGLILICEAIENGDICLTDMVSISSSAASMGGSQVFLQVNEQISVDDLIKCICICSANDAMYAMSEVISSSNENFIEKMNQRASEIGCSNTNFVNVTGFDDPNHYSCAKDMALIGLKLLEHKDIILPYTSTYDSYIRQDSDNPFWLVNTNKLIRFYEGMDGLKTGYTSKSGFCLTSTAKKNNIRLVSVVMNAKTSAIRNEITTKLLNYGFSNTYCYKLYNKGDLITNVKILKAKEEEINIIAPEDIYFISNSKINSDDIKKEIILDDKVTAPLKKGEVIGKLIVSIDNISKEYDLILSSDVKQLLFKELFGSYIKDFLI